MGHLLIGSESNDIIWRVRETRKINATLMFNCPECGENFEFDDVGEYELVPCPICGIDFMTVRKGQKLLLEAFPFKTEIPKAQSALSLLVELEC
jgi:predicted RNA-binding Zn-ribbon protein involved in translation (DUF1610 family)